MSDIRAIYDTFQRAYDLFGSGFTPEHPVFTRGGLSFVKLSDTGKYHLPSGCLTPPGLGERVLLSIDEVDTGDLCSRCIRPLTPISLLAVEKLLAQHRRLLEAVEAAGGVVKESGGGLYADLREILTREKFPLPAAQHPRDWYDFWVGLTQLNFTHKDIENVLSPFGAQMGWMQEFKDSVSTALTRWTGDREVFTNLMYARARHAMLCHESLGRTGEIKSEFYNVGWPFTVTTVENVVLADVHDISTRHVAALNPADYGSVGEYRDAQEAHLRQVAFDQLCTVVDTELDAFWDGEDTLLEWNWRPRFVGDVALGGWFFPAIPGWDARNRVVFGTVADAFANGGLDAFSLIWETAETINPGPMTAATVQAAVATLGSPVNA